MYVVIVVCECVDLCMISIDKDDLAPPIQQS